jgi:hypothetical protein
LTIYRAAGVCSVYNLFVAILIGYGGVQRISS